MMLPRRDLFELPEGVIYLDGNSLGPPVRGVAARVAQVIEAQWRQELIGGWTRCGWMAQPRVVGDRIARLIGAPEGSVVVGDTLSIKVFQALAAALDMRPDRRVILSDCGNFPSDLYMAEGLVALKSNGYELKLVAPEEVESAIDDSLAAVLLTEVDYRTGRRHDMRSITRRAQAAGAVTIWDLAHSAGAIEVDVTAAGCEFAVGCTYKYLNGGPGAPAFIHVRPDLSDSVSPALAGWLGHAAPFAFETGYRPARGIERMRVGTPPVLQMAALDEALKIWDGMEMARIRAASVELGQRFITGVEAACPELRLISPRDPARRGSQVAFAHPQGLAIMQALIARGVIGDFRAPDVMRFGIAPLYIGSDDIDRAVAILAEVMHGRAWDRPEYRRRPLVT